MDQSELQKTGGSIYRRKNSPAGATDGSRRCNHFRGKRNCIGKEYRFLGLDWSYLVILGLIGNLTFSMRFLVQWIASERQGESIIPVSFWYWSIGGSVIMCLYFIFKRDPVGILAYLPNSLIYIRNLMLIQKGKSAPTAAAPSQHPREMG